MNISYKENHSMDEFYNDENIEVLVNICLKNYNTFIFDDIIGSITLKNKESVLNFLNESKTKYNTTDQLELFNEFKQSLLNLFEDSKIKNLKGAFLEVLSFKIFELEFKPYKTSKDCKVLIDDFESNLTVDIAMEYSDSGLICECKVPASRFNWDIFKNLLEIKSQSLDYFNAYAVTLDTKQRLDAKKTRISNTVDEAVNLDEIICIHRENISNLMSTIFWN